MRLPPITIIVTTWFQQGEVGERRAKIAQEAIASWERHLKYEGPLALHVADDGSDMDVHALLATSWAFANEAYNILPPVWAGAPQRSHKHFISLSDSRQERKGVGASLNAGVSQAIKLSPLFAYFVDDWVLDYDLDLTPWAKLLMNQPQRAWAKPVSVGMVRLGPPHPGVSGRFTAYPEGWALIQNFDHFCFGFRPALYHRRFTDAYGPFPEGVSSLECERLYNMRVGSNPTEHVVYAIPYPWRHIGEEGGQELSAITPGKELQCVSL